MPLPKLGVSREPILLNRSIYASTSLFQTISQNSDCWSAFVFWQVCQLFVCRYKIPSPSLLLSSYRPTADLIELFLRSENVSRHRILTSFASDAIELEDVEPPISVDLSSEIQLYQPVCEWVRPFNEPNGQSKLLCGGHWGANLRRFASNAICMI